MAHILCSSQRCTETFLKFWCPNTSNVFFASFILTKDEQSHSLRNKHPYHSLLPQFKWSAPKMSTMEVKCLLCLTRRSAVAISPAITIPASENSGSHYWTKGSLIDWLTDMNFQKSGVSKEWQHNATNPRRFWRSGIRRRSIRRTRWKRAIIAHCTLDLLC